MYYAREINLVCLPNVQFTYDHFSHYRKIMSSLRDLTGNELADWMSKLPTHLLDTPLSELAIPGEYID